jgi:hypothetical protein
MHPAIVYLTVLARWLSGGDPLAIRYGVATAGLLGPAAGLLGFREIGRLQPATGFLADPLCPAQHLHFSHHLSLCHFYPVGFESMLPALPAAVAFGGWRVALRTGLYRWYGLVGVALGLALYTILTRPAFCPLPLRWPCWGCSGPGSRAGRCWWGGAITAVTALILFLPAGRLLLAKLGPVPAAGRGPPPTTPSAPGPTACPWPCCGIWG